VRERLTFGRAISCAGKQEVVETESVVDESLFALAIPLFHLPISFFYLCVFVFHIAKGRRKYIVRGEK